MIKILIKRSSDLIDFLKRLKTPHYLLYLSLVLANIELNSRMLKKIIAGEVFIYPNHLRYPIEGTGMMIQESLEI